MLRREGIIVNHNRVHRIYRKLGLQLRPRRKRSVRYVRGNVVPPVTRPNERWSIDDYSRECIAIEVDFSFPSRRVIRVFDRLAETRRLPATIKSDNGGEFTSEKMLKWSGEWKIDLHFIEPGKPT